MANAIANNVDTSTLSAQTIYVEGKELKQLIHEESTGSKVTVTPEYTEGVKLATIRVDDEYQNIMMPKQAEMDYFAFEVFPTNGAIPSGSKDTNDKSDPTSVASIFGFDNKTATGETYTIEVPAEDTIYLHLRGDLKKSESDVVVDFGDGTVLSMKDIEDDPETTNGLRWHEENAPGGTAREGFHTRYWIAHKYQSSGKFIVKIYGKVFYILPTSTAGKKADVVAGHNIISRAFASDLPLGKYASQLTYTFWRSYKLLKVDTPRTFDFTALQRLASTFIECRNLKSFSIDNFANRTMTHLESVSGIFQYCTNLTEFYFFLPSNLEAAKLPLFRECTNLTVDILKLLGGYNEMDEKVICGFSKSFVCLDSTFASGYYSSDNDSATFTCSDYNKLAYLLWKNSKPFIVNGSGSTKTFSNCKGLDLSKIPTAWGGTDSSTICNAYGMINPF